MSTCKTLVTLLAWIALCIHLNAQQEETEFYEKILEEFAENAELDGALDYNTLLERLQQYAENPIDLNRSDLEEFVSLGILSPAHQTALKLYILKNGPLISQYELQAVPGFDSDVIRRIQPFVSVGGDLHDVRQPITEMLFEGRNEIFLRWAETTQQQNGFTPREDGSTPFQGGPARMYTRFRHTYENRLSYGITAEKDPGEEFFAGSNASGFDFYSYHFFLNKYRSWIPRVAIGDYNVSLGQGLVMHAGFGYGKSSFVSQIKKGGYTIRPSTSVNEFDFLRGAAVVLAPGPSVEVTLFASSKKRDANIREDTVDLEGVATSSSTFSSLQSSGLHRTLSEIADKNQIGHRLVGGAVQWERARTKVGLNIVHQRFDRPFVGAEALYNRYRFSGDVLTNASIDYTYYIRNLHFFGETGWSDNGIIATINGLLLSLHRNVDAALLMRYLPRDYHTVSARTFGETATGNNETGVYMGIEIRPLQRWTVSGYIDTWKHPWLRFGVDGPSTGQEMFFRVAYRKKRKYEVYIQYRTESKEKNLSDNTTPTDQLVVHRRRQLRLHFSHKLNKTFELRNRAELSFYKEHTLPEETGFMIYQDFLYRPIGLPFSFTTRLAIFDTKSYDTRIYAYENDLINQFYIPAYAYKGTRFYVNLKYRGIRNLTLEFRFAQTRLLNRDVISSGLNEIEGNRRTDLKAQVKYVF